MRYGTPVPQEVLERYETEMKVIGPMGFSSYFLVVADICSYARDNGIPVGPGRGSAHRFDRRLRHPHHRAVTRWSTACCSSGSSTPSASTRRTSTSTSTTASATAWCATSPRSTAATYTAQVNTFGTIKAKAAVKDASRILGYPFAVR